MNNIIHMMYGTMEFLNIINNIIQCKCIVLLRGNKIQIVDFRSKNPNLII
jgi:hypothetical protein